MCDAVVPRGLLGTRRAAPTMDTVWEVVKNVLDRPKDTVRGFMPHEVIATSSTPYDVRRNPGTARGLLIFTEPGEFVLFRPEHLHPVNISRPDGCEEAIIDGEFYPDAAGEATFAAFDILHWKDSSGKWGWPDGGVMPAATAFGERRPILARFCEEATHRTLADDERSGKTVVQSFKLVLKATHCLLSAGSSPWSH